LFNGIIDSRIESMQAFFNEEEATNSFGVKREDLIGGEN
jgi:hypothetical protein